MKTLALLLALATSLHAAPIALHPDNPHYFLYHDKPLALVSSAEHYGAVLNLDFDYRLYLDTLAAEGMNYTRVFSGAYVEPKGAFNIARNTLAPDPDKFICPWQRTADGRFDLEKFDPDYLARLTTFVAYAAEKNVVVELTLFCPMYKDDQWHLSPMNAKNNINGVGDIPRDHVYTLDKNAGLLAVQENLTRHLVTALNPFDNVIFEICNEPYFGGVTLDWQHRIADMIVAAESPLPNKHLIAQNIANKTARIENPHPAVSVFNFHYATPPDAVTTNYHLNKVIGDDETGFRGTADTPYRTEAWAFLLAGGGLYNNLDYSFTAGHEDGTFGYPDTQPGGGNTSFRKQIKILSDFVHSLDFVRMKPDNTVVAGGLPDKTDARALVDPGRAIAVYLHGDPVPALQLRLPPGTWQGHWVDTKSGATTPVPPTPGNTTATFTPPAYQTDIALQLQKK